VDENHDLLERRKLADDRVNPMWKWAATLAVGIILGGGPGYISLEIDQHNAIKRADVDLEITNLNAPILVEITDLKDQVRMLNGKIDEYQRLNARRVSP
jgi:hypothetical protein